MAVVIVRRRNASMGDPGNIVNIVSWLLLVVSMGLLVARFCMKLSIKDRSKRYGLDDLFIVLAAVFSIGHTISTSFESFHSLGQPMELLTPSQLVIFQKTEYAGCILYMANMGCARISMCFLIKKVLPGTIARTTAYVFGCFTVLWMISGIFTTAFHCSLPNPWRFLGNSCVDMVKWVNYIGITNIVVELLLISIPLIVWNLRTSAGKRLSVSLIFMTRLSIVAAVSTQLYFFNRSTLNLTEYWHSILCVQVAQNLSIITACLPVLHPFIIQILAGAVQTERIRWRCSQVEEYFKSRRNDKGGDRSASAAGITDYDLLSSQSTGLIIDGNTEKNQAVDYCRPLATYGLDRVSSHMNMSSHQYSLFPPSKTVRPVSEPDAPPPKDIFMSPVPIPSYSRPSTAHSQVSRKTSLSRSNSRAASLSRKASKSRRPSQTPSETPQIPQTLSEVGVLPIIDWDTESSGESGRSTPSRRPNSTYIFNRSKVISVPEESHLRDGADHDQYYKKYYPPLPSPKTPKKPPRNF